MSELGVQGGLRVDDTGTRLDVVKLFTVNVDPPSIGANLAATVAVALPAGTALVGDKVFAAPPPALEAALVCGGCWISAADQVSVRIANASAGAVDGASRAWDFLLVR